jgi:hypothetical protein
MNLSMTIANGTLWLQRAGEPPRELRSPFAQEVIERDAQSRRTSSWKHAPREQQSGVIPSASLWGRGQGGPIAPARFLYACDAGDGKSLYYLLNVGEATALLRQNLDDGHEVRLFHRSKLRCHGMAFDAGRQSLILAFEHDDGTAHLEVFDADGNRKGSITDGDCIDASPSVVPGAEATLVYQSTGVARHADSGHVIGSAHAVINRIDYRQGRIETLLEDRRHDFVAPRLAADGTLYAIRRPALPPVGERAGSAAKDVALLPFRLAKAVFGYLNFFSMIYGKEPLRSAGGPRTPELDQDLGRLWLHGRLIELSQVRNDPQFAGNLVPRSWELVRRTPDGRVSTLADHVAAYCLAADGQVLMSNGYQLFALHGSDRRTLAQHDLIEWVGAV